MAAVSSSTNSGFPSDRLTSRSTSTPASPVSTTSPVASSLVSSEVSGSSAMLVCAGSRAPQGRASSSSGRVSAITRADVARVASRGTRGGRARSRPPSGCPRTRRASADPPRDARSPAGAPGRATADSSGGIHPETQQEGEIPRRVRGLRGGRSAVTPSSSFARATCWASSRRSRTPGAPVGPRRGTPSAPRTAGTGHGSRALRMPRSPRRSPARGGTSPCPAARRPSRPAVVDRVA